MMWVQVALLSLFLVHCGLASDKLHTQYQWNTPEFAFPSEDVKQSMIDSGSYIPGNSFMLDVDSWNKGLEQKVFVTTPRFRPGTPATLSVISRRPQKDAGAVSPQLEPFPSWEWNRQGDCNGLTSVFRMQVDPCGRLWVIDSGAVDVFSDIKRICPPQIFVFHVLTNKLVSRYRIPQENLKNDSLLITIAADVRDRDGKCREAFAYVADVTQNALVVYDANEGKSWRVTSSLFNPYPAAGDFTIAGESFTLLDGIFGLALGPIVDGDSILYFHSLASFKESWVQVSVLRNESLFLKDASAAEGLFTESSGERSSQTAATAMDKNSVLFFNLLSNTSLNCWNSHLPYTSQNLVELVTDEDALQFVSGMKVVQDSFGNERLWALSCRFQRIMTGSFNPNEVNFRIVTGSVADLVRGTSCDSMSNVVKLHDHPRKRSRYSHP